ncbi:MAG: hypothetical protein A3J46_06070 [Candidatus Yanofskybacteria bacterium RIFCSPHIGHO2_02_FULL_41_11]|uniref:Uncharacterized protein n=1 Tax=Candidatus Yanofskybacteria bacterium RIFCSPHIGHO2_02_FULL_41_11 TaxID=1802675 RepID=A0A1F8F9X4_9BACT|nr:MAG: hypothetical protein A3J46_06070 [Candidatus Yanofskybacteria bacterium RIFCSPHIGHO2_02_FULL_41_11]
MLGHRTSRVVVNGNPGSFLDIEQGDFVREGDPEFRDGRYIGRPLIITKLTSDERVAYDQRTTQNKANIFQRLATRIFG